MGMLNRALMVLAGLMGFSASGPAFAGLGQPSPWQIDFQESATPIMTQITDFHNYVNIIIIAITLFVLALMIYVMVSASTRRKTPNPPAPRTILCWKWLGR